MSGDAVSEAAVQPNEPARVAVVVLVLVLVSASVAVHMAVLVVMPAVKATGHHLRQQCLQLQC